MEVKEFIRNYFEAEKHTPADGWDCAHLVEKEFGLSFAMAFDQVSHYLSKEVWKIN